MADVPWRRAGLDHSAEARTTVELLQTDVMRFMAILGFCLMAIFALVHSIPPSARTSEPQTLASAPPPDAIDQAYAKLEQLNQELDAVGTEVAEALKARDTALARLGSLEESEQILAQRRSRAQTVYQQQLATIAEVGARLREEQHALEALQQRRREETRAADRETENTTAEQAPRTQTPPRAKAEAARARPAEANATKAQTVAATPRAANPAPSPTPAAPPAAVAGSVKNSLPATTPEARTQPKVPEQKSYVLRFSSDLSLRALIAQHQVGFFGFVGKDAWQLRLDDGVLTYRPVPLPERFHEMTPETVPHAFVQAFQDAEPRRSTAWGVTLPRTIQEQIERHVNGDTGGTLVIHPDGRVRLNTDIAGG